MKQETSQVAPLAVPIWQVGAPPSQASHVSPGVQSPFPILQHAPSGLPPACTCNMAISTTSNIADKTNFSLAAITLYGFLHHTLRSVTYRRPGPRRVRGAACMCMRTSQSFTSERVLNESQIRSQIAICYSMTGPVGTRNATVLNTDDRCRYVGNLPGKEARRRTKEAPPVSLLATGYVSQRRRTKYHRAVDIGSRRSTGSFLHLFWQLRLRSIPGS